MAIKMTREEFRDKKRDWKTTVREGEVFDLRIDDKVVPLTVVDGKLREITIIEEAGLTVQHNDGHIYVHDILHEIQIYIWHATEEYQNRKLLKAQALAFAKEICGMSKMRKVVEEIGTTVSMWRKNFISNSSTHRTMENIEKILKKLESE